MSFLSGLGALTQFLGLGTGILENKEGKKKQQQMYDESLGQLDKLPGIYNTGFGDVQKMADNQYVKSNSVQNDNWSHLNWLAEQQFADNKKLFGSNNESLQKMLGTQYKDTSNQQKSAWDDLTSQNRSAMQGEQSRLMGQYSGDYGKLAGQLSDRTTTGMNMLEGQGDQGRRDIIQNSRNNAGAAAQGLSSSGFGGGQFMAGVAGGQTREASDATNRLNEDLARLKLSTYASLSGDQATAQERYMAGRMGADTGLSNNILNYGANQSNQGQLQQNALQDAYNANALNYTQQGQAAQEGLQGAYNAQMYGNTAGQMADETARTDAHNYQQQTIRQGQMNADAGIVDANVKLRQGQDVSYPDLATLLSSQGDTWSAQGQQKLAARAAANSGGWFNSGSGAGIGMGAGMGVGALLAAPTGGMSMLGGAMLGGGIGGAAGMTAGGMFGGGGGGGGYGAILPAQAMNAMYGRYGGGGGGGYGGGGGGGYDSYVNYEPPYNAPGHFEVTQGAYGQQPQQQQQASPSWGQYPYNPYGFGSYYGR